MQDQEDLELMAVVSEALKLDVEPETPSEGHTISRLEGESSYSLPEDVSAQAGSCRVVSLFGGFW